MFILKVLACAGFVIVLIRWMIEHYQSELKNEIIQKLGFDEWPKVPYFDEVVNVKSRQALDKYDAVRFFKEHPGMINWAQTVIQRNNKISSTLGSFLDKNEYKSRFKYRRVAKEIEEILENARFFRVEVNYISSAGNNLGTKSLCLSQSDVDSFRSDPCLLIGKTEYRRRIKAQQKEALSQKQSDYYDKINSIIDIANESRNSLIIKESQKELDTLIEKLFSKTVNSIKNIKTLDSEEWGVIDSFIEPIKRDVYHIVFENKRMLEYYESQDFLKIKETCKELMNSQREFNEYINEKVQSISNLLGTKVVRSETIHNDKFDYIRPYKKTITPFTAEVSSTVFASAENNPLVQVVKHFYSDKEAYREQIAKLYQLVEELETLKDAKTVIDNYKKEYQQYIGEVPKFIMENDEAGFYSRLGFANVNENALTVEYTFSYTSNGGKAHRFFSVRMTEDTIIELIKLLESKLTAKAFAKEQRTLMTRKLREFIKQRDHFTCCNCGNSTNIEPNLLLEIDHIIPIAKGGLTTTENLQTLCWKCNRAKSDKIERSFNA